MPPALLVTHGRSGPAGCQYRPAANSRAKHLDHPPVDLDRALKLRNLDPLPNRVRLLDVARPEHDQLKMMLEGDRISAEWDRRRFRHPGRSQRRSHDLRVRRDVERPADPRLDLEAV